MGIFKIATGAVFEKSDHSGIFSWISEKISGFLHPLDLYFAFFGPK
jgi:hypothetical protein